ncbi:MAG TPA: xanthine dehydrogenase family protein subunit M [Anaerolineales bacterium]|nr:xanthine dehydrogenase family protein subunit M [Anaerolineales bacterium]
MQVLDYIAAGSVHEVIGLLTANNGKARVLSGGTDLIVQLRENRRRAELLIDLKKIDELTSIRYDPQNGLRIGAAASCSAICQNEAVIANFPGLVDGIRLIGGVQIQSRASIGGNLCNASPAADSIPALIVHGARCLIVNNNGTHEIPVEQFCVAPGRNILRSGEFLLAVVVPVIPENFGAHYLRFIPRNEMDIAVVGAGASVTLDQAKEKVVSARVALGAVAPTPLLVEEAGSFLAGKEITTENIQEAAKIAQAAARPISDLRGTAEHRKHLCAVLTRRALEGAIERARVA